MNQSKPILASSDHAGLALKLELIKHIESLGYEVEDLGTHTSDSVDYPDFGLAVGEAVARGDGEMGLCVCGSGIGIAMAANKVPGIRAAVIYDTTSARLARAHNNANVACLGERLIGVATAKDCIEVFLATDFEGGRHIPRVEKLDTLNVDAVKSGVANK